LTADDEEMLRLAKLAHEMAPDVEMKMQAGALRDALKKAGLPV
jgi:hypothetical protein